MNYINQIDINLPRARVVELFDNTENLKEWMPGLVLFETFEGQPGKPGAKSKMEFQMGKRKIQMIIKYIITLNWSFNLIISLFSIHLKEYQVDPNIIEHYLFL